MFETLASKLCNNPHAFVYEMFNNDSSLEEVLEGVRHNKRVRHIVLAAHGDGRGIRAARDNKISRTKLSRYLYAIDRDIEGLFLDCCELGSSENVQFLLNDSAKENGVRVKWIAGYRNSPKWLESAAFDLLFWTIYYDELRRGGTTLARMKRVCRRMRKLAMGLIDQLGFTVYVRDRRKRTRKGRSILVNLISEQ